MTGKIEARLLFDKINDTLDHAKELVSILIGKKCYVKLSFQMSNLSADPVQQTNPPRELRPDLETSIEYEKILESAQTPILDLNPRGALVYANESASRLLGLKKGGEAAVIFQQVMPELSTAVLECISIKRSRAERLLQLGDIAIAAGITTSIPTVSPSQN